MTDPQDFSEREALAVPTDRRERLAQAIASADSPVGIDAGKTHVLIIHQLLDIQERLARVEAHLARLGR